MTSEEQKAIAEAVEKNMPLALGEVLGPMIHSAVRSDTRRWRKYVVVGYVILVIGLGYAIHDNRERGAQTTGALCALRGDLEQRVAGGENFLRDHPEGFPGVPAATLRSSIDGQIRTIRALSILTCPKPHP